MADDVFSEIVQSRGSQRPAAYNEFERATRPQHQQKIQFKEPEVQTMAPVVHNQPQFQQAMTLDQIQQRKRELVTQINPVFQGRIGEAYSERSEIYSNPPPPINSDPPTYSQDVGRIPRQPRQDFEEQEALPSKITTVQLPPQELKKRNQQRDQYRAFLEKQMKQKEEKKAKEEEMRKAQEEKEEREAMILQERMRQQREMELGRAVPQQSQSAQAVSEQHIERPKIAPQYEEFSVKAPVATRNEPQSANFVRFKVQNMKDEVEIEKRQEKARKQRMWQEELKKQMEERERKKRQQDRAQKEEEERLERKLQKQRELLEKQQAHELKVEKWKDAVKRKEQGEEVSIQELTEPSPPSELYVPAKVTQRKNNQMFLTSQQIEQQKQKAKDQWSAPPPPQLPPEQPISYSRGRDPVPAQDPFARQESSNYEAKVAGFQAPVAKASRQDLFSPPGSENQNIMNLGPVKQAQNYGGVQTGGREQLGEVERMRYETEMKLLMQEKQKLEEQMMWKQREQQMRDQMFQMMVMMQAGGKVDPQELMKQYFIIQQQMNPNAVPNIPPQQPTALQQPEHQFKLPEQQFIQPSRPVSFQPSQSLGYSGSERSLTGSRGRMPTLENNEHLYQQKPKLDNFGGGSKEIFQVQTQFHQLPQILHQGGALPQPTDRSDCTLPQSNTFIPHSEMPSVNSSAFQGQNIHTKLDHEELQKSLTSETKLIAAVASTEGRLRKKLKELQNHPDSAMINTAMMSETWVPSEKRMDMRQEDQITENSNDRFDTFRQNMKDINDQIERLDQNLQKKKSASDSYEERESIKTESVKSGTGTFNFQNTGQYSPMSTDKRQTFYDQIKSLELTESQMPGAKQDVTVVNEAPPTQESFTDLAESSYIQKNMREIEERVEKELQSEGFVKNSRIIKTPTLTNIGEAEGTYVREKEDEQSQQEKPRVIRKSWSKQAGDKQSLDEEREYQPQEVEMAEEVKNEESRITVPDASQNLEKLMEEMAKGYEREEEINIACTTDALLPPEALELMKGKIEQDRKTIEEANKRFQSSARVGGDAPSWLKNEPGVIEESTALKRPNTGMWMPQAQSDIKASQSVEESMAQMRKEVQKAVDSAMKVPMRRVSRSAAKNNKKLTFVQEEEQKESPESSARTEKPIKVQEESTSNYNLAIGESTLQEGTHPNIVTQSVYGGERFKLCLDSDQEPYETKMAQTGMESVKSKESLKGMRLQSLRDLRDQVKRSQNRDNQIFEGLEQHVRELEEQVLSSKGFEKTQQSQDEAESPSLRYDQMIDKMIAQFQPPESLTRDL